MNRKTSIEINKNSYNVEIPNTGQELDIEILKLQISNNKYEVFKLSFLEPFQKQALKIEAVATFNTLIPQLKKDLNTESMFLLSTEMMDIIVKAYVEQYLPFYEEYIAVLNKPKVETEVKK